MPQDLPRQLDPMASEDRIFDRLTRVADSDLPILLTGESGTGKELAAHAIHVRSSRRDEPFVAVNCAALPETLLESELFGHVRGAFTDARGDRKGLFVQANNGTLFLDEIGEVPLTLQPKLLRALEQGAVRAVGSDKETRCDVRVIAATNRDLEAAAEEGTFRQDLLFRLNALHLSLPPLRARGTDILLLAQHFLDDAVTRTGKSIKGLSPQVADRLLTYRWPGNVRELRNAIESSVALTRFEQIAVEDLPDRIRNYQGSQLVLGGDNPDELAPLHEIERRYILYVLQQVEGNKSTAAQILGVDRKTLYRKLELYGELTGD